MPKKNVDGTVSVHADCSSASDVFHEQLEGFRVRFPNKSLHVSSVSVTENMGETPKLTFVIEATAPSLLRTNRPRFIAWLYEHEMKTETVKQILEHKITDVLIFSDNNEVVRVGTVSKELMRAGHEDLPHAIGLKYIWSYLNPAELLHACMPGRNFHITIERMPDIALNDWNGISTQEVKKCHMLLDANNSQQRTLYVRTAHIHTGNIGSFGMVDRTRFRLSLDQGQTWSEVFSLPYSFKDAFTRAGSNTVIHMDPDNNILQPYASV